MSTQASEALAHRFHMEILVEKKYELIEDLLTADFVAHIPVIPLEATRGHENIKNIAVAYNAGVADWEIDHVDTISAGDKAAIRFNAAGKHVGELFGVPSTGKRLEFTGIDIFRIENGKIAEMWQEVDFLGVMKQMGAIPG